jgi:two-component system response regulator MtrA
MEERVLLVEDDPAIRDIAAHGLELSGFEVVAESDGRTALIRFRQKPFNLVILDVMLPSLDGFEVCRQIRRDSDVPILMLTAKTDTVDVVVGLEAGADDYVTKPFEMPELIARIRAVLRRANEGFGGGILRVGDVEIDPAAFKVSKADRQLLLTATEFRLLLEFAQHVGQVLTRDVLLERIWNYDYLGDSRVVDMAVTRLRQKIEDDPSNPRLLQTVRGVGYRLEEE